MRHCVGQSFRRIILIELEQININNVLTEFRKSVILREVKVSTNHKLLPFLINNQK